MAPQHTHGSAVIRVAVLLLPILAAVALGPEAQHDASAEPATATSSIEAQILGKQGAQDSLLAYPADNAPVEGATIEVKGLGLKARTDAGGRAEIRDISVSPEADKAPRVDIVIKAPGYGSFTYRSVPLLPGNGPILTPVLRDGPVVDNIGAPVPPVRPEPAGAVSGFAQSTPPSGREALGAGCSGWSATDTPPAVIRVYHNNTGHGADNLIHTVDFMSYVQHVLPFEWGQSWHQESLRAGAVAVKMYGWDRVINWHGGTIPGQGCYDVDSTTNYQVWDPGITYPSTNQAVADTWDYYLTRSNGTPYETLYTSGYESDTCGQYEGHAAQGYIMSQYGSKKCAEDGLTFVFILVAKYYFNPVSGMPYGPHATAGNEGLPVLAPSTAPYNNSQVRISWGGQSGVAYHVCYGDFISTFANCNYVGTGVSQRLEPVPQGDDAAMYYRLLGCKNGYCSAVRAGACAIASYTASGSTARPAISGHTRPRAWRDTTIRTTTPSSSSGTVCRAMGGHGSTGARACRLGARAAQLVGSSTHCPGG